MRELKFRAWDTKNSCWQSLKVAALLVTGDNNSLEVHSDTLKLMQYTGLRDKNGVEIYEGDIVENLYDGTMKDRGVVEFDTIGSNDADGNFYVYGYFFDDRLTGEFGYEVIGNIYENPELLK